MHQSTKWLLLVVIVNLHTAFTPTHAFDLDSLLAALGISNLAIGKDCPKYCNCTRNPAQKVMMQYVDKYLPDMGARMNPKLEPDARQMITLMTQWLGHMAEVTCHLPSGENANISDLLQPSSLSFKALKVTCGAGASLVWDLTTFQAFLNVLDITGCRLEKADGADSLPVPLNLWVLHVEQVAPDSAELLDFSASLQLLSFSWTRSGLRTVPQKWASASLVRALYVNLAFNNLENYPCVLKVNTLEALNLDHNNLTDIPDCVLNGDKYTNFLSMRHNHVTNLNKLILISSNTTDGLSNNTQDTDGTLPIPWLYSLDLAHNKIESLPPLKKVEILRSLDLSNNYLSHIDPETFTYHPLLDWLDLSNNMIAHVPDGSLTRLTLMRYLNLSHNRLHDFNFDQSPVSSEVLEIDVSYNRLSYPPFEDTGYVPPQKTYITAANNPFLCDCNLYPFIRLLANINNSHNGEWFGLVYWDNYQTGGNAFKHPFSDNNMMACSEPADIRNTPIVSLNFTNKCPLLMSCPVGCECQLIHGDKENVVVDCSSESNVTDLPFEVPLVKDAQMILLLNSSGLKRLDHRPYLRYVKELYAENSKISFISSGAMEAMENISVLSLHNNQLRSLPAVTQNLTMSVVSNLSLAGNPWTCGCQDLWMPQWLEEHAYAVYDFNNTRCRWTGEMVADLNGDDMSCELFNYLPIVVSLTIIMALIAVITSLLIKYRLEVLVFLYTRFNIRPFDMYKYKENRRYLFDVFVSFSQHDCQWVAGKLVDYLENRDKPYKLCIHLRDFPAGAPIAENISWAIHNSRCTLLVLTKHFMASEWCRHELRAAHERLLKDPQAKLLVIVHGPLDARVLDRELLAYLRTHTYLRSEDKWFWGKLEYALPQPMGNSPPSSVHGQQPADDADIHGVFPDLDMDAFLPAAMAAGDVSPKRAGTAGHCLAISL